VMRNLESVLSGTKKVYIGNKKVNIPKP